MNNDKIRIRGARENNLKNVDLDLPKNSLIVMTGVSGSGKSSLAFDTIFAEGQRRFVESLSSYARQFLGNSDKPDVDSIDGLSPSIAIDQKTTNNNPRSTVGTVTEIYDYLKLLYARIGTPYCPNHHEPIVHQSIEEMTNKVMNFEEGTKLEIMAPVVRAAAEPEILVKLVHRQELDRGYAEALQVGDLVNEAEVGPAPLLRHVTAGIVCRESLHMHLIDYGARERYIERPVILPVEVIVVDDNALRAAVDVAA